jgi:hypothetical protein
MTGEPTPGLQSQPEKAIEPKGLIELHDRMKSFVDELRRGDMSTDLYVNCVRAAFAKAFDFCVIATEPSRELIAFFLTPALRGICEDLVVLGAIRDIDEPKRSCIVNTLLQCELRSAADRQEAYFKAQRPYQPVMLGSNWTTSGAQLLTEVQTAWKDAGYSVRGTANRPTTASLARAVDIEMLYEYLYGITSDVVHFNPRVLLRTGWGDDPSKPTFSVENFSRYYASFCVFYGHHLLGLCYESFRTIVDQSGQAASVFVDLAKELDGWLRWPEVITFEECNIKGPSQFVRLLMRVAHEGVDTESESE